MLLGGEEEQGMLLLTDGLQRRSISRGGKHWAAYTIGEQNVFPGNQASFFFLFVRGISLFHFYHSLPLM